MVLIYLALGAGLVCSFYLESHLDRSGGFSGGQRGRVILALFAISAFTIFVFGLVFVDLFTILRTKARGSHAKNMPLGKSVQWSATFFLGSAIVLLGGAGAWLRPNWMGMVVPILPLGVHLVAREIWAKVSVTKRLKPIWYTVFFGGLVALICIPLSAGLSTLGASPAWQVAIKWGLPVFFGWAYARIMLTSLTFPPKRGQDRSSGT